MTFTRERTMCTNGRFDCLEKEKECSKNISMMIHTILEARIVEIVPSRLTQIIQDGMDLFLYK
jgi:hypothetical protein